MADIVRYAGQGFIERRRKWINGQHEKVLVAITGCRTAALAAIEISALAAATSPSPITRAATVTAHDARATPTSAGLSSANGSCCPHPMSMPCSRCRVNWLHWRSKTSG
jgi:hypothetical protein